MVVGDPAGMRQLADRLVKDAEQLGDAARAAGRAVTGMDASGEWADACRVVVKTQARQLTVAADRLRELARTLRRSATEVEEALEAERRREQAAARAAEEARRAAVQRAMRAQQQR